MQEKLLSRLILAQHVINMITRKASVTKQKTFAHVYKKDFSYANIIKD